MSIRRSSALVSACILTLAAGGAFADSLADRMQDTGNTQQANDPIEEIHQTYGPTAAGPGQQQTPWDSEQDMYSERYDFPDDVNTAHERFRYIFESGEF